LSDDQDTEETPEQITKEVIELGRQLNLEIKNAVVDELIASHSDAETDEEIMVSPSPAKTLGIKHLALIFQKADELVNMTEEEDTNEERSSKVRRGIEKCWHATKCYMKKRRRLLFNLSWTSSSLNSQHGSKLLCPQSPQ
jgi:hypothetical protein